jgi:hypothetical protein
VVSRFRKVGKPTVAGGHTLPPMRPFPVLAVAVLGFTGCGGDGREEAVRTAETWLRAVGDRDAERACELMHESAVDVLRKRGELAPGTKCLGAVRVYGDAFDTAAIDAILKIGLEAEGRVKDDELGVFPRSGERELQVILMRRVEGEWKVASTSLGPTRPEPSP